MSPWGVRATVSGGGCAAFLLFAYIIFLTCCDHAAAVQGAGQGGESTTSPQRITIITPPDVLADYRTLTENRDVLRMTHFAGVGSRRDVVEIVLIRQALWEGGMKNEVVLVAAGTYLRIIEEITSGMVTMSGNSMWLSDLDKLKASVFISRPFIRNGEFEVGFYTSPRNLKALNTRTADGLRHLTAVSNRHWLADWSTLAGLNLKTVFHVQKWKSMVRMVDYGRADLLLAPFQPTRDLSLSALGIRLVPIQGIKVRLEGSRHVAISRKHVLGKKAFESLNKGLKVLRRNGVIAKAYEDAGFFNGRVAPWKELTPL